MTIGIATAHGAYRLTSSLGFNALFSVPVVASSFVLLFNYGLATALLGDSHAPLIGVYRRECCHLLPWFVAASYLVYLVRCATLQTGWQPGVIALPILFAGLRLSRLVNRPSGAQRGTGGITPPDTRNPGGGD